MAGDDSTSAYLETLRRVPLFNELSENELSSIAARIVVTRFDAGQIVFSEGERGGDLLIVKDGRVRIVKTSSSGREQLIGIERAGSSLGEVSVFDGGVYSTTAITLCNTVILRLRGDRFRSLCLSHPAVAVKVIRVLGYRLRQLRNLVEQLSFATVRDRLIAHILTLAAARGKASADGIEIELDENNEELAARLGTVRELVSRNLGTLHSAGFIRMRKRAMTMPDEALLRSQLLEPQLFEHKS